MNIVTPGTEISLALLTDPAHAVPATIVSLEARRAELAFSTGASLEEGALVQFQTSDTLYLGEIESREESGHARVLIEHSVDLERAAAIRKSWNVG